MTANLKNEIMETEAIERITQSQFGKLIKILHI